MQILMNIVRGFLQVYLLWYKSTEKEHVWRIMLRGVNYRYQVADWHDAIAIRPKKALSKLVLRENAFQPRKHAIAANLAAYVQ
jgi:hypothetical protein